MLTGASCLIEKFEGKLEAEYNFDARKVNNPPRGKSALGN